GSARAGLRFGSCRACSRRPYNPHEPAPNVVTRQSLRIGKGRDWQGRVLGRIQGPWSRGRQRSKRCWRQSRQPATRLWPTRASHYLPGRALARIRRAHPRIVNRAEGLARLLRVLAAIISEPGLNPLELAEKAGVSERTLSRDLAQLRDLGYEVAYTRGYEVQEKLNLDGRARQKSRAHADDALLQAVAQAVEKAGLWRDT